nr:retrotransposon protein, putative, Ty1-copia subclass [Tanacetum cinerariifolium]
MTRISFPHRPERATDLLGIIHTDVCGLLRHMSRQGASYFITFIDDYSRYGYVYLLKHKHEVFETFKVFKNEVKNQLEKTIKALRSDRVDEFKEEEDPQEEEEDDDMEVDIEEDENELELTYPCEEVDPFNPPSPASESEPKDVDPFNPPSPASESEPKDVTEAENPIEHKDETVPASVHEVGELSTDLFLCKDNNGLLPGLMRRYINPLFGQIASLSRRLCFHETAHALVKKKGKAKDKNYGKLILDLGNEVHFSVEQGTTAM